MLLASLGAIQVSSSRSPSKGLCLAEEGAPPAGVVGGHDVIAERPEQILHIRLYIRGDGCARTDFRRGPPTVDRSQGLTSPCHR
jgi:hypothetical protein